MKRVLVTGGVGFIGLNIVKHYIAEGYQVDIIDNLARGTLDAEAKRILQSPQLSILEMDLTNPNFSRLTNHYDYIFHLAAIIGVQHVLKNPFRVLNENVLMLSNIVEFAKKQKYLKRFLFASTSEVNAGKLQEGQLPFPTPELVNFSIPDIKQPRTSYLLSKIYGEAMTIHSGLPYTIFRPHNVFGPRMGMSHVIPELLYKIHRLARDTELPVYSLDHQRTFCYIDNFIDILTKLTGTQNAENKIVNIGVTEPELTMRELANKLLYVSKREDITIIDAGTTPGSPVRRCPDMQLAGSLIDNISNTSLDEGILRTYHWYLEHVFTGEEVIAV